MVSEERSDRRPPPPQGPSEPPSAAELEPDIVRILRRIAQRRARLEAH